MSYVLLIGLGDLGTRIAMHVARDPQVRGLVLAAREGAARRAALVGACSEHARVRFVPVDALDGSALEALLRRERPDLVVQCACLLSPWGLLERRDPAARCLHQAGFAAQLPAQLAIVWAVMTAVRQVGLTSPVVNCSYPDQTHPVLAARGLAPTIGTGNVGMILRRVRAALRAREPEEPGLARVLGHHVHVTGCVLSRAPDDGSDGPRVYLGESGDRADHLAYGAPPLASDRSLNALSAAAAAPVIAALLDGERVLRTSAPGPLGLPGGYPVRIAGPRLALDLPPALPLDEAVAFQRRCARRDGVERIDQDGTVFFTEALRTAMAALHPKLAEPLPPEEAVTRVGDLTRALAGRR